MKETVKGNCEGKLLPYHVKIDLHSNASLGFQCFNTHESHAKIRSGPVEKLSPIDVSYALPNISVSFSRVKDAILESAFSILWSL